MYHISDLKKFSKCPRLYFLDVNNKNVFQPYLRSDESYIDLLKKKLNVNECFHGKVGDTNEAFFNNQNYTWYENTRFEIGELRIRIPLMKKSDDGFDIFFLYYGTCVKDIDFFSYRINVEVLEKLGLIVKDIYVVYINGDYVYSKEIDPDNLFVVTNRINNTRIINMILDSVVDYNEIIDKINSSSLDNLEAVKTRMCHLRGVCEYYNDCFKDERSLDDDSILTLVSSQYKNKMYEDGIVKLKDVDLDSLEGNRVQYAQVVASRNGGLFCDKYNLKEWLNTIKGPISFIDFEWDRYLIPAYEKMKPLDVIPFEFALYVDDGRSELKHMTFISSGDCRREFVEELIKSLPKEGTILAYNAKGAEVLRIKELMEIFPEYKDELENIVNRFVDLATPFIEGIVYDIRMGGVYSLKKLVSVVSNKTYEDLDIDDGMKAVYSWRSIDKGIDEDEDKTIDSLKKYCSLDAYALYLVYKWLVKLVE